MAEQRFSGKVALVMGGASGIGRACVQLFAKGGASVVVSDVALEGGQETMRLIEEDGGEASFVEADVSKAAQVEALVGRALKAYGHLDFAFNNAGIEGRMATNTADYPEEDWDRVIGVNLKGVWLCMKHEIPQMLRQGGARSSTTPLLRGWWAYKALRRTRRASTASWGSQRPQHWSMPNQASESTPCARA